MNDLRTLLDGRIPLQIGKPATVEVSAQAHGKLLFLELGGLAACEGGKARLLVKVPLYPSISS